jgi:uncharacterized membrane protein (UPF0127 family)
MNKKKQIVLYTSLGLIIAIGALYLLTVNREGMSYKTSTKIVQGDTLDNLHPPIAFEVVTTQEAREKGLGGRTEIPHNYGMLFVFPSAERYGFWMKDMRTPIDIVWLSDNGTILGIEENISPETYPKPFHPPTPVRYVLEMRAGEAAQKGWSVGARIDLPLPYRK